MSRKCPDCGKALCGCPKDAELTKIHETYGSELSGGGGDATYDPKVSEGGWRKSTEILYKYNPEKDMVNSPEHYQLGDKEALDIIESSLNREQFIGYLKGNMLKYLLRAEKKDEPDQDLKKAHYYSKRLCKVLNVST